MNITVDLSYFAELISRPPHLIAWEIFIKGGWVLIPLIIFRLWYGKWILRKRQEFLDNIEYTILAVDVPRENEQGPKAVEQIFAQLAVIESGPSSWRDFYIDGVMQTPISLEIISMGGYIQFLIRVPNDYKDLAEAAIYSQYPDAEITEVEDYAGSIPVDFPSEEYDLWGTELALQKDSAFPIKTYTNFEDPTNRDENFKDPMSAIMEVLSKIGDGENIWMQILAVPAGEKWKDEGLNLVKKMLGFKVKVPENTVDKALKLPLQFLQWVHTNLWGEGSGSSSSDDSGSAQLTPGERKVADAIEDKISKVGFYSKFRIVYWGDKDVFSKSRGVAATMGAIKQFSTLNLNGFVPAKSARTGGSGRHAAEQLAQSQSSMGKAYLTRAFHKGAKPFVLNIEELATIFHFPMKSVKAPLLQRSQMKVAEAPAVLPTETFEHENIPVIQEVGLISEEEEIPEELKEIMEESASNEESEVVDFDEQENIDQDYDSLSQPESYEKEIEEIDEEETIDNEPGEIFSKSKAQELFEKSVEELEKEQEGEDRPVEEIEKTDKTSPISNATSTPQPPDNLPIV